MARTLLPALYVPNASNWLVQAWTSADVANGNRYACTSNELLLCRNTDGVTHTITVASVPDAEGRTSNIANEPVTPGDTIVLSPRPGLGWAQGDGSIWITADSALIQFAVINVAG